jgi:hypothetical protein
MPYRVVRDLVDRLAVPWLAPGPAGVLSWWLSFLIGNLFRSAATAATRLRTDTIDQLVNNTMAAGVLAALGSVFLLSAAIEAIRIVREVQKRSTAREAALSGRSPGPWAPVAPAVPAAPAAPPGWAGASSGWAPPPYGAAGPAAYAPPAQTGSPFGPPATGPAVAPPSAATPAVPVGQAFAAFCPRCGARRLTADRFCASCGFDLVLMAPAPAAAPASPPPQPGPAEPRPAPPPSAGAAAAAAVPPAKGDPAAAQAPPVEPPPDLSPAELADWSGERIFELDALLDRLYEQGRSPKAADDELTEIGKRLHAAGGEPLMRRALQRAQSLGMRGRYVERHWTGIGSWMG